MELAAYSAGFLDGAINPRGLPLRDVRLSAGTGTTPGTFSARIDLRESGVGVLPLIQPAARTIAVIREDVWSGDAAGYTNQLMGEWLILDAPVSYADPVVQITGVEVPGYLQHRAVASSRRTGKVCPMGTASVIVREAFDGIAADIVYSDTPDLRTRFECKEGAILYADAVRELRGDDDWDWLIASSLSDDYSRIERRGLFGRPARTFDRTDFMLEAVTPGKTPTGVLDFTAPAPLSCQTSELYAFGAGSGAAQRRAKVTAPRGAGMPVLSTTLQAHDVNTAEQLDREAKRALAAMRAPGQIVTMLCEMARLPGSRPQVGDIYSWTAEPSLSMPQGDGGKLRVDGWEWSWPKPGEVETCTLTMRRV